jgi:catechol 2,3-dioxygenase-like lactoylglutathione lyase family enzyme
MAIPVIHDGPMKCVGCGLQGVGVMPFPAAGDDPLCGDCVEVRYPHSGDPAYGKVAPAAQHNGRRPREKRRVVFTAADTITPERVEWLWQHRMPVHGLSLIAGEAGLGKSTADCRGDCRTTPAHLYTEPNGPEAVLWIGTRSGTPSTGVHVAFEVPSRELVDAFHAAALEAGGSDNGAPGVREIYHPTYYGAYVFDPDGNNVEAVCHRPA